MNKAISIRRLTHLIMGWIQMSPYQESYGYWLEIEGFLAKRIIMLDEWNPEHNLKQAYHLARVACIDGPNPTGFFESGWNKKGEWWWAQVHRDRKRFSNKKLSIAICYALADLVGEVDVAYAVEDPKDEQANEEEVTREQQ